MTRGLDSHLSSRKFLNREMKGAETLNEASLLWRGVDSSGAGNIEGVVAEPSF